jgi:hypothetical protein
LNWIKGKPQKPFYPQITPVEWLSDSTGQAQITQIKKLCSQPDVREQVSIAFGKKDLCGSADLCPPTSDL